MVRVPALVRVSDIAEDQWGLVTRRQAEEIAGVAPATFARMVADGLVERVAHGVYRVSGAPVPDHQDLRAAWLQLAPGTPAWERTADQGVISHRSAAALFGIGHLPADRHDFTLPVRRQGRRGDMRLHQRFFDASEWLDRRGLLVTRPSRIASDLLYDREDPTAVAHVIVDAIGAAHDLPGAVARALSPHAARFRLRRGDGLALLRWLLDLTDQPESWRWLDEAARTFADGPTSSAAVAP